MSLVKHWQFVENVVVAIESIANEKLPGLEITPKAMIPTRHHPNRRREVDVLVRFRAGSRTMRVGVDVKAESKPLDVEIVEGLWAKARHLDLDRYAIVSLSGFTAGAREVYAVEGVELVTLSEVENLRWAGLTHITRQQRLIHFTHIMTEYEVGGPTPSAEQMGRASRWTVRTGSGPEERWFNFLARHMGSRFPMPTEPPFDGPPGDHRLPMVIAPELRAEMTILDEGQSLPVPVAVECVGRFVWETRTFPLVKYRTERGEEVASAAVELTPGAELMQVSLGRVAEGAGHGLAMRVAPAEPSRFKVD